MDANGERHVILCRVIMGRSEKVEAGSLQFHPSSEDFDSGVDDLENPKWYILWSTCMNTRILPEYVVSFKSSKQSQGIGLSIFSCDHPLFLYFLALFDMTGGSSWGLSDLLRSRENHESIKETFFNKSVVPKTICRYGKISFILTKTRYRDIL